jgi:starch phosphorylase
MLAAWLRRLDAPKKRIAFGESVRFEIGAFLDGLKPEDIALELIVSRRGGGADDSRPACYRFESEGVQTDQGEQRFGLELSPDICGKLEYQVRAYPHHPLLTHPFEMGMMRWL